MPYAGIRTTASKILYHNHVNSFYYLLETSCQEDIEEFRQPFTQPLFISYLSILLHTRCWESGEITLLCFYAALKLENTVLWL